MLVLLVILFKKVPDLVLIQITQIGNLYDMTLSKVLESCKVTKDQYYEAVKNVQKMLSVTYKWNSSEVNIGPCNTVILLLLQGNIISSM